jgi:hypothetical protein
MRWVEPADTPEIEHPPHDDVFATFVVSTGATDPVLRPEGLSGKNAD